MKAIYGRISTTEQNEVRQLVKGEISFIDKCSGAVPFMERPQAKRLLDYLKNNPTCETEILSVDRIGRSTLDILQTIQFF
jgi:DNA invertase Pin-like site-specific DNA recombinase